MTRTSLIILVIGLVLVGGLVFLAVKNRDSGQTMGQTSSQSTAKETPTPMNEQASSSGSTDQLQVTDEVVGTGTEVKSGDTVKVDYTGTFTNGQKFDSSKDHGQPFSFTVGAGQVIQGWDQGLVGMKVGGKRKLVVPPNLGYGSQANGPIPANSTLIFEIDLLDVTSGS